MRIAIKNLPFRRCLATLARDTSPKQGEALFRLRFLRFTHFVRFGRKERKRRNSDCYRQVNRVNDNIFKNNLCRKAGFPPQQDPICAYLRICRFPKAGTLGRAAGIALAQRGEWRRLYKRGRLNIVARGAGPSISRKI